MKNVTRFVNLTPHDVNIMEDGKIIATFPSVGNVRVGMVSKYQKTDTGIPVGVVKYTELTGLPDPEDGTAYILSSISFNAAKTLGRTDVCFPAGRMFRNDSGQIIGVEFLAFNNE